MTRTQKYPIINIYETIQGQGIRTGEPIILIRNGLPKELKYAYLKPVRQAPIKEMGIWEIMEEVGKYTHKTVFFGGEDPAWLNLEPLLNVLSSEGYSTMIDTCGMFELPLHRIDHLSLGPKPGLPYLPVNLRAAHDIRLYWDNQPEWIELINTILSNTSSCAPVQIIPRRLDPDCMQGAMELVKQVNLSRVIFNAPLYRIIPTFDACFCDGEGCPICNYIDEKPVKKGKKK